MVHSIRLRVLSCQLIIYYRVGSAMDWNTESFHWESRDDTHRIHTFSLIILPPEIVGQYQD